MCARIRCVLCTCARLPHLHVCRWRSRCICSNACLRRATSCRGLTATVTMVPCFVLRSPTLCSMGRVGGAYQRVGGCSVAGVPCSAASDSFAPPSCMLELRVACLGRLLRRTLGGVLCCIAGVCVPVVRRRCREHRCGGGRRLSCRTPAALFRTRTLQTHPLWADRTIAEGGRTNMQHGTNARTRVSILQHTHRHRQK